MKNSIKKEAATIMLQVSDVEHGILEESCTTCAEGLRLVARVGVKELSERQQAQLDYALRGLSKLLMNILK